MNINHVIHSGGFYGAERMLLDHCLQVPGRHRVIFLDGPGELLRRFSEAGVTAVPCAGLKSLYTELRRHPGLLNAHNFRAQLFSWLCARRLAMPLVWTQHGFTPRSLKQQFYTWLALRLGRSRTVTRVACVSRGVAELHLSAGVCAGKLRVIPNGLPPRASLPRAVTTPLVGYVGRLSHEKGPDQFLDALLPVLVRRPEAQAVLIGDGPLEDSLAARIQAAGLGRRIHLAGYQTDIAAWLARLSVLVISSRTEGTPMVLLEAMAAGTPVAAFAVGGIPDVVENGEHALLAPPGQSALLGDCVLRLLEDKSLADRLARAARLRQASEYALPQLAVRWQELYRQAQEERAC